MRREDRRVLHDKSVHVRIEESQIGGDQLVEERTAQADRELLTMDEIEGWVSTRLGLSTFCAHSFIPSEATSGQIPTGFVEIVIIATHIHIDILTQIAV